MGLCYACQAGSTLPRGLSTVGQGARRYLSNRMSLLDGRTICSRTLRESEFLPVWAESEAVWICRLCIGSARGYEYRSPMDLAKARRKL